MSYTHIAIAQPDLTSGHLLLRQGWSRFYLVGTIRTEQAAIFVFESENPIDLALSMELFGTAPEMLHLYGNCDGFSYRQRTSSL